MVVLYFLSLTKCIILHIYFIFDNNDNINKINFMYILGQFNHFLIIFTYLSYMKKMLVNQVSFRFRFHQNYRYCVYIYEKEDTK